METNRNNYPPGREDSGAVNEKTEIETKEQSPEAEHTQPSRERSRHHHSYGIGRYRSFSNHSSASDQPHTNTGPGNF